MTGRTRANADHHRHDRRRLQFSLKSLLLFTFALTPLFVSFRVISWNPGQNHFWPFQLFGAAFIYGGVFASITAYRAFCQSAPRRSSAMLRTVRTGAACGVLFCVLSCGLSFGLSVLEFIRALSHLSARDLLAELLKQPCAAMLVVLFLFGTLGAFGGVVSYFCTWCFCAWCERGAGPPGSEGS